MLCDPVGRHSPSQGCTAFCHCGTRRTFLKSVAAASAALAAPTVWLRSAPAIAATTAALHRIDIHHHMFPPFLQERWKRDNVRTAPVAMLWTLEDTIKQMNDGTVATAILSLASGGLNLPRLGREENRRLTRMVNDYGARARDDNPGRFGLFAYVPMPDVDGTLKEIEYALDELKADGIGLSASYANRFLGDPDYKPVMEELQRRKAIVHVHPVRPDCCDMRTPQASGSFIGYPQDTYRTVMSLLFGGTFTRTREVRWILSHAGAAVPQLAERVNALAKIPLRNVAQVLPDGIDFELKRLHYETANATYAPDMAALLKFVPSSQVLFGTDYPFVSVVENVVDLAMSDLPATDCAAIERDTALRLMPRLNG